MHNVRYQFPVGQGCFHAGLIGAHSATFDPTGPHPLSGPGLLYVYDCGSLASYAVERNAAIADFHRQTAHGKIDILFLSHMHEDHISGVAQLCDPTHGAQVDTVVLPLLNVIDRLICFARASAEAGRREDEFIQAMAVDPVAAISRFNPRQIIVVNRGGEDGAPRPGEFGPELPEGPFDQPEREERRGDCKWQIVGRGWGPRKTEPFAGAAQADSPTRVFEIDDTQAFAIRTGADVAMTWLLAPYVDQEVSLARDAFIQAAADLFGMTPRAFENAAADPAWLLAAVVDNKSLLIEAYETIANLNVTSLSLYSGPFKPQIGSWWAKAGSTYHPPRLTAQLGWFGTGDADLKKKARRDAFKQHYTPYLRQAQTLLLPHHGSEHNFHPELLTAIEPGLTMASAAPHGKWRHPGTGVVQAVASTGRPLWVVTEAEASRIVEFSELPVPMSATV